MATSAIAFIIIVSALFSGAVEVWSSSLVLFLTFTLGLACVLGDGLNGKRPRHEKKVFAAGAAFILYALVQVIPLPADLMRFLSPETYHLYSYYSLGNVPFMSISLDRHRTVIELLKISAMFTFFLISANRFRKSANLSLIMSSLVVAGFCLSLFALVQKAAWNGKLFWFRELMPGGSPFGPFVNRNHFAGFIGMIIPLGIGLVFTAGTREKRILFGFLSVVMSVALFFSLSRGGIVSFFAGVCLFSLLMMRNRIQSKKVWVISLFLSAVACYVLYLGIDPIIARFYSTDIRNEARLGVWSGALYAFKDFWLTGSGLGTFVSVFPLYAAAGIKDIYEHAHNDYIELIMETGVLGAAMMTAFLSLLIYPFLRSSLEGRKGIFRIAVASSLFVMAVHSLFDFNLHILSNGLLFSAVLGMAAALSDHDELNTDATDDKG